jgi:hypothetical protein
MKCTACERDITKKETLYTEDKLPFCNNAMVCNEEHPNSVKNILARQAAVEMFTEDELETNLFENLGVSAAMKERIMKIATKPQSIRLSKVDVAHYLIKLQDSNESLDSLSACIRYCVQKTMEHEPIESTPEQEDPRTMPHHIEEVPEAAEPVAEVVEPEPTPEPEPVTKEDEDEFTF